ncbi:MAG: beta-Ala-His dipeptidase [Promethearchaeota archaeon]
MTEKLRELGKPHEFWEYFEEISKIPRCSGKEERIREFVRNEAMKLGFETEIDKIKNIVVRIPSKSEQKLRIVLQCHLDMVCEKNEDIDHDFSKDPLKLKVIDINDEKWVTAEGTTLGADNGVGIAYNLTIMKKIFTGELNFGSMALDLLFTVSEEMALGGAKQLDKKLIEGKYLINLDSERDDTIIVGCAGGNSFFVEFKINRDILEHGQEDLIPIKISVLGLMGGHSGIDIHLGRANSIKIISQILWKLLDKYTIQINSIKGGKLFNAIPREAQTIFYVKNEDFSKINAFIIDLTDKIKDLFGDIEPNMKITVEKLKNFTDNTGLTKISQENLLNILYTLPNGPIYYHSTYKELVHTSSNLAAIQTRKNRIKVKISQRSFNKYGIRLIYEKILSLLKLGGLEFKIMNYQEYIGWPPIFNSEILSISKKVYKELFREEPLIEAVHAGLECAFFKRLFPEMEMIAIGSQHEFPHSPDERLNIKSVEKIWNFLIHLLLQLNK